MQASALLTGDVFGPSTIGFLVAPGRSIPRPDGEQLRKAKKQRRER
jgi:hypothetical protein